tara:strand:- start:149 stop:412 length:264 start_codon:yes stop_codon:yes gene_type:complete
MMLGAIALAGGALVLTFWFIVWVEFDWLIFLLVLSDTELLLLVLLFVLLVWTLESEVDLFTFVLLFVLVAVLVELFVLLLVLLLVTA